LYNIEYMTKNEKIHWLKSKLSCDIININLKIEKGETEMLFYPFYQWAFNTILNMPGVLLLIIIGVLLAIRFILGAETSGVLTLLIALPAIMYCICYLCNELTPLLGFVAIIIRILCDLFMAAVVIGTVLIIVKAIKEKE